MSASCNRSLNSAGAEPHSLSCLSWAAVESHLSSHEEYPLSQSFLHSSGGSWQLAKQHLFLTWVFKGPGPREQQQTELESNASYWRRRGVGKWGFHLDYLIFSTNLVPYSSSPSEYHWGKRLPDSRGGSSWNGRKMGSLSFLNPLDNPIPRIRQNTWLFCVLTDMVCKEVFSGFQSIG